MRGWQSGYAAGCRPAYVGSNPAPRFKNEFRIYHKEKPSINGHKHGYSI